MIAEAMPGAFSAGLLVGILITAGSLVILASVCGGQEKEQAEPEQEEQP